MEEKTAMANNLENKICAICLGGLETGHGQAIFTGECSHSFHFGCIGTSISRGNTVCPVCRATWNDLPSLSPKSPRITSHPQSSVRSPVFQLEPLHFSDDEPLPDANTDPMSIDRNVTIKAIPEIPVVAASAHIPQFAVLVGLKAPSLPEDASDVQRAPIDLVMVLDVSGSMHGSKLALLKRAVNFVIDNLGPSDRLSVVSFSDRARRIFPLRRMMERAQHDAKLAVNSLSAGGLTNIVGALQKGVQVLEERRYKTAVASIIFLSDGRDTCQRGIPRQKRGQPAGYLHLLPPSIYPASGNEDQQHTFPVHAFGFGSDHDPLVMHAISDSSGGTFSFIESYEMVQDAFAGCIGGLLSVVAQDLRLMIRSASHGVKIISIQSGRYTSEISNQGFQGAITIGDLYADEEKEFIVCTSVPTLMNTSGVEENDENERKTSLLDITCSYRDIISKEMVHIEGDLVDINRPDTVPSSDFTVNLDVDRQRNRLSAVESIAKAQQMAETGNLLDARALLSSTRLSILASAAGQAGDDLCMWLEADLQEIEARMGSMKLYERAGRAYTLSNMSSHGYQRATTKGERQRGSSSASSYHNAESYETPQMARMVRKSQQLNKNRIQE